MSIFDTNYWPILAVAIINMVIGAAWYGIFSRQWLVAIGRNPNDADEMNRMRKGAGPSYVAMFVAALVFAFVMAVFIEQTDSTTGALGACLGFLAWLGFYLPAKVGNVMFAGQSKQLLWIDGLYQLVVMVVAGLVIGMWH